MAETEQTIVCPLCAETIKAAAKVCPHCRNWQKKWSLQNPQVMATFWVSLWIIVFAFIFAGIESAFGPKKQFATYRDEIRVINSEFSQRVSGSNVWNTVVGTLTNESDVGWKDIGVEAQFFNKAGQLIDVITVNANDYRGVTILPRGEAAYKIESRASHPEVDYSTSKLTIRWAKDVDAWLP